jgi:hypothetical protein
MEAAHGYFEHDADIGIIGRGATVEEAFVSAARAMFAIQTELDSVQSSERIEIDSRGGRRGTSAGEMAQRRCSPPRAIAMALCEFGLVREGNHWLGRARRARRSSSAAAR